MYLLYIDESGDLENPADHFVVGGLAVHESRVRALNRTIDGIATRHLHFHLELHAQWIRAGKGPWGSIPKHVKASLLREIPTTLGRFSRGTDFALFAVVRAPEAVPAADPLERSFEELLLRFTQMLIRHGPDHGIVIADKAKYEHVLQPIVQHWRTSGTRFSRLGRLAEVPLFIDSRASRLTQAADFVAHGVYRHYAHGDSSLFTPMLNGFDFDGGVRHGLVHLVRNYRRCPCPACVSRTTASGTSRAAG